MLNKFWSSNEINIQTIRFFQSFACLFLNLLLFSATKLKAQEVYGKDDVWFLTLTEYQLNQKWTFGNELHLRFNDGFKDKQQILIRPYVSWSRNLKVQYSVGYTYINNYPYSKYPLQATKPEHNIWEQLMLRNTIGKLTLDHRYRMEHRFESTYDISEEVFDFEETSFSNRFRYRISLKRPIAKTYFINLFNELWIQSNKGLMDLTFDRNWIYIAIGKNISKSTSLQLAYFHQNIRKSANRFERHPTLQISLAIKTNQDDDE